MHIMQILTLQIRYNVRVFFPLSSVHLQGLPQKSHTTTNLWHISFRIRYQLPVTAHPLLSVWVSGAVFPVEPARGSNLAPRFTSGSNPWCIYERGINKQINLPGETNNTVMILTPPYSRASSHFDAKTNTSIWNRLCCASDLFLLSFPFHAVTLCTRWSVVPLCAGLREALMCHLADVISRQ